MEKLRIASSDILSTFQAQAQDLGSILVEEGVAPEVEVLTTTGSAMNAEMVARGDAEIGFMASNWVPRAIEGGAPFTSPAPVAIVAPLNAGPIFFVTRADSPLSTVADLKGKRVAVGHRDSGMAQHTFNLLRTFGWGEDGMDLAFISTFDGGDALANGEIDAQLQAPIPSTHFTELCSRMDIKVLPFGPGQIDTVCDAIPFYFPAQVPADFVPGLETDEPAVGVLNVIVAAADAAPDLVEAISAAYIRRATDLGTRNPLFRGLAQLLEGARGHGREALAPAGTPLHGAAEGAFRAAGLLS
jgi:TRAP transporter TAXI family solute receptor